MDGSDWSMSLQALSHRDHEEDVCESLLRGCFDALGGEISLSTIRKRKEQVHVAMWSGEGISSTSKTRHLQGSDQLFMNQPPAAHAGDPDKSGHDALLPPGFGRSNLYFEDWSS